MNHLLWLPGLAIAGLGALIITWAVWPLRPRRAARLPRHLALGRLADAMARAELERNDENDPAQGDTTS